MIKAFHFWIKLNIVIFFFQNSRKMGESNIHERSSSYDPTLQERYHFVKKKSLTCTLAQLICELTDNISTISK